MKHLVLALSVVGFTHGASAGHHTTNPVNPSTATPTNPKALESVQKAKARGDQAKTQNIQVQDVQPKTKAQRAERQRKLEMARKRAKSMDKKRKAGKAKKDAVKAL